MGYIAAIKSAFLQIISNSVLKKHITTIDYLPRWIIFCIDMTIVIFANIVAYLLVSDIAVIGYTFLDFVLRYGVVLFVNMIFFAWFRSYSGIIRHSTFIDGLKLLTVTSCTFGFLLFINAITYWVKDYKLFLTPVLFISYLVSFVLLLLFRIFVKYVFEIYQSNKNKADLVRVLIFGTDSNAISVANALNAEVPMKFVVIGFVDKENQNSTKSILDLPILNFNRRMPVLMRSVGAKGLILADRTLSKNEKLAIVDDCLDYNCKVYTIPAVSDWEDKKEIANKVINFQIQDLLERKPIVLDTHSISQQLHQKTLLISGAAGSIGSEIVRQVLAFHPKKVIILDQAETPLHQLRLELENLNSKTKIRTIICDVRSEIALRQVFIKFHPEVVFHAAAYKHVPLMEENPTQAILVNVLGTKNITDLSSEFGVENFVMVSTDKAVNPSNIMGASKRIAEKYVQSFHGKSREGKNCTKFITTRFGNVLGSNGSVVPLFTEQIAKGGPITITHPDIIRYFMTIPEACQLVLEAGAMGNGGEIFIFDMGKPVKIIDLANKMIRLAGLIPEKDIQIKIVGLRPGEKLYEELLNDSAKTLPTHHKKIMIAKEIKDDYDQLKIEIEDLIRLAELYKKQEMVAVMKAIVPEFISMNSTFEALDAIT